MKQFGTIFGLMLGKQVRNGAWCHTDAVLCLDGFRYAFHCQWVVSFSDSLGDCFVNCPPNDLIPVFVTTDSFSNSRAQLFSLPSTFTVISLHFFYTRIQMAIHRVEVQTLFLSYLRYRFTLGITIISKFEIPGLPLNKNRVICSCSWGPLPPSWDIIIGHSECCEALLLYKVIDLVTG